MKRHQSTDTEEPLPTKKYHHYNTSETDEDSTTDEEAAYLLLSLLGHKNPEESKVLQRIAKEPIIRTLNKDIIHSFLEAIIHENLSDKVLTDITFRKDVAKLIVVGRPNIKGTSKQLNHVIPFSFVKNLVKSAVDNSVCPQDILASLCDCLLIFVSNKKGFVINTSDLQNKEHIHLADRAMDIDKQKILLFSPSKGDKLFSSSSQKTKTIKAKAMEDFAIHNVEYVKAALEKLKEVINDHNTATIASEALARFIFILFNQSPHTAFAPEGNTAGYEIRLYPSQEAAKKGKKDYTVMPPRELQAYIETSGEDINLRVRIVDCEGARIKKITKALKLLNDIVIDLSELSILDEDFVDEFNRNSNILLKLENYEGDITQYNETLTSKNYQECIPYQIAKLLYSSFDLKALENEVFAHTKNGDIKVYSSATGKKTAQYSFCNGDEERKFQIDGSKIKKNDLFRSKSVDLAILPQKLTELFIIGTMPFLGFKTGFFNSEYTLLHIALKKLVELAAMDYMLDPAAKEVLGEDVFAIYNVFSCSGERNSLAHVDSLEVVGDNNMYHDILNHEQPVQ